MIDRRPGKGAHRVWVNDFSRRVSAALDGLVKGGRSGEASRPLIVAFSGGLDSCVLLHVLRFGGECERPLIAAHLDHGMRSGSAGDADWVRGVCRAWDVTVRTSRVEPAPTSEAEARRLRYLYLETVAKETDAEVTLTAHHADDQAETVLFRALRGTGIAGLRGIHPQREPGVARPLLAFFREDLEAYARAVGLRWREDPTNEHLGYARNVLRHSVLPELERSVAPGARAALARLARVAERNEEAWAEALPAILESLGAHRPGSRAHSRVPDPAVGRGLDAAGVAGLGAALRGRVLRHVAKGLGVTMDERATERAVRFAASSRSGTRIELGRGLELRRDLDRLNFVVTAPGEIGAVTRVDGAEASRAEVEIAGPEPGCAAVRFQDRQVVVRWQPGSDGEVADIDPGVRPVRVHFLLDRLRFPLRVRARRPGDRIARSGGTTKVKKLLLDSRVPVMERGAVPVVEDAGGVVIWVAGVAEATGVSTDTPGAGTMTLEIEP